MAAAYRPDIDGLRAIAVGAVILYHAKVPGFSGGFVGVDIFFVISGYLITRILMDEWAASGRLSIADFYIRRARRILPAYVAATLVTVLVGWFLLTPAEYTALFESAAASALFIANFYFADHMSYFQTASEQLPLLHLWSLAVEEQFYIVWPIAAFAVYRLVPPRFRIVVIGLALIVALMVTEWALRNKSTTMVFFWSPFRAWEFLLGAILVMMPPPKLGALWSWLAAVAAAVCLVASIALYRPGAPLFPGVAAALPCFGTALLIYVGMSKGAPSAVVLGAAPLRGIGLISYSLYLWHWPVFAYARVYLGRDLNPLETSAAIAVSIVLAIGSWKFIEGPFRRRPNVSSLNTLGTAATVLGSLLTVGVAGFMFAGFPQRSTPEGIAVERAIVLSPLVDRCLRERQTEAVTVEIEGCSWGDGETKAVLWGDSHASAYFVGMARLAEQTGETIELWSMRACDPAHRGFSGATEAERACNAFKTHVLDEVLSNKEVSRVYISGYWASRFYDPRSDLAARASSRGGAQQLTTDLSALVERLSDAGKEIVLLGEPPIFPSGGGSCVQRRAFLREAWQQCAVSREWTDNVSGTVNRVLDEVAKSHSGVIVFDPLPVFCDESACTPYVHDEVAFVDVHHFNEIGAAAAAASLVDALSR
jgi:peptidoglycan/LPS O-acetylase OafA/YrhL